MKEAVKTELVAAVAAILAEADADIAARRPVCKASGRCCKFEQYGHRMYVTEAELTYFSATLKTHAAEEKNHAGLPRVVSLTQFFGVTKTEGCPYQIDGLCTARDARPLGCRVYFCDENAQHWQNDVYEKYHAKLKKLHETFAITYRYVEWRDGLRRLVESGEQS